MSKFIRSNDFLQKEGQGWLVARLLICFALAFLWGWWFCAARIGVYEISSSSTVEVSQEIHPVQASAGGRVTAGFLGLGKHVAAGELLVQLDDSELRMELDTTRVRLATVASQIDRVYGQMTSMRAARQHEKEELAANQVEAESQLREAQMRASFAKRESEQAQSLVDAGTLARFELERSVSKAHQEVAAAESAGASVRRIIEQQRRVEREGTGKIQYLEKEAAALAGDQQAIKALIQQLEHQIELLRVCAPVDGIVAEIEPVNPGTVVQSGRRIATILPSGTLKVVAQFPPAAVVGRVKSGQTARLLVDQFPWTQYGAVPLVVNTVGTDAPDGYVRVEFLVDSESHSRIPLQHGLRGTTEVLVERTSPLRVLLRILGRWYVKSAA